MSGLAFTAGMAAWMLAASAGERSVPLAGVPPSVVAIELDRGKLWVGGLGEVVEFSIDGTRARHEVPGGQAVRAILPGARGPEVLAGGELFSIEDGALRASGTELGRPFVSAALRLGRDLVYVHEGRLLLRAGEAPPRVLARLEAADPGDLPAIGKGLLVDLGSERPGYLQFDPFVLFRFEKDGALRQVPILEPSWAPEFVDHGELVAARIETRRAVLRGTELVLDRWVRPTVAGAGRLAFARLFIEHVDPDTGEVKRRRRSAAGGIWLGHDGDALVYFVRDGSPGTAELRWVRE